MNLRRLAANLPEVSAFFRDGIAATKLLLTIGCLHSLDSLEDNPDDVVIDYEEVFVPSSLGSPAPTPLAFDGEGLGVRDATVEDDLNPLSPKRSRSSLQDAVDSLDEGECCFSLDPF